MWNYVQAVLAQAENRNMPRAQGWCWFLVHLLDLVGHAIELRADPGSWFRDRGHWHLDRAGRMPVRPLADTLAIITGTREAPSD